ncbi:hypothetical protein IQ276_021140 [Desmonostoc muscorum LEGE 12446]|uniref:PEP-CTERM sorting domain-containing protein n=1 Tax=Desmonostoc muscorum LEGE 12446 TaxID=1828758 RepID=A0A8J7D4R4_DESMC|nr:hypothetical protein [Desmonostoc muscorum]MCF2148884.1 hypothetical protein [Desmonostoc muscorum LEGE 12446]
MLNNIFSHKFNTLVRTVAVVSIGFATTWGVAMDSAKAVGFTVDSVTLGSLTDGSDSTVNGVTYLNQSLPITGLSANSTNWTPDIFASPVITLRRGGYAATDNFGNFNNRQIAWGERLPGDPDSIVRIPQPTNTQAVLSQNNILQGSDNVFVNTGYINGIQTDIERVDFVFNTEVETSDKQAITIFDRGLNTAHDSFQIAPILSVDSAGNPTIYGSLISIAAGWGQTNLRPGGAADNNVNSTVLTDSTGAFGNVLSVTQQVGGLLIPLSELATTGSKIYGYSLFSPDVNDGGNPINLLDWTNASVFPQDTPNSVGGIDLVATNLGVVKAVPEPSFVAGVLLFSTFVIAGKLKNRGHKNSNA